MTDDTRISGLEKATMKEKTGLNKSDYHLNIESRDSEVQMIEDGRNEIFNSFTKFFQLFSLMA
jgi:hypothetical protein